MYVGAKDFPKQGKWQEAIIPTEVDDINREEEDEHFTGLVGFRYRNVTKKRSYMESEGIKMKNFNETIETQAKIKFKEGDKIISQEGIEYEIVDVETFTEEKHRDAVRVYPALIDRYKINRIYLR